MICRMFLKYIGDGGYYAYVWLFIFDKSFFQLHGFSQPVIKIVQRLTSCPLSCLELRIAVETTSVSYFPSEIEVPSTLSAIVFVFMDLNDLMSAPPSIYLLEISRYSREKGSMNQNSL